MRLRYTGPGLSTMDLGTWADGDERNVSDYAARCLLAAYPAAFSAAPQRKPKSRAMKAPRASRAMSKPDSEV